MAEPTAAPAFRLIESTDVADLFGEPDPLLHPPAHLYRYHCGQCGRFVPFATVEITPHWEYGYGSEQDTEGVCKTHGRVDVIWGQQ